MATVLIVDDSTVDRRRVGAELERLGHAVKFAHNGNDALTVIATEQPDLVITDLVMPELDGLDLIKKLKAAHMGLPVIVMTAHGSEEVAVTALKMGAASYVPKKNLARDLEETVRNVLSIAMTRRAELQLLETLTYTELRFVLTNEIISIRPLIQHMQTQLRQMQVFDDNDIIRISTALQEALINAIEHGNLEMSSDMRELKDFSYSQIVKDRAKSEPYCQRRVFITVRISREQAEWIIRDEGPGYDPSCLPDPRDPANLQKVSGRGLLLIRTFMDEVYFSERANEIRMVKRAVPAT